MNRERLFGFMLVLVSALTPLMTARVHAQYYEGDEDYELTPYGYRDHTGFFSHVDISVGWSTAFAEYGSVEIENTGIGTAFNLALGGSVMPRFAVHFSLFNFDTLNADLVIDGTKQRGVDGGITSTVIGGGATYYLPFNLYFSGALGVAFSAIVDGAGDGVALKPGLGARASVGYEWWVGHAWGLGVAAQVQYFRAKDDDLVEEPVWQGLSIGPAFSATSN